MPILERVAPEIPVTEMKESLDYYGTKLGFQIAMKMPDGGYAIVERDGVALHLFEERAEKRSRVSLHIFADGLDDLLAEFERQGVRVTQRIASKPWGARDFRLKDPSGNEIKFTEPSG